MALSLLVILISQVKTSAKFLAQSAALVLRPTALHACTEPLLQGSSVLGEAPTHRPSVPAVPCWCVQFFLKHQWPAGRFQARHRTTSRPRSLNVLMLALGSSI